MQIALTDRTKIKSDRLVARETRPRHRTLPEHDIFLIAVLSPHTTPQTAFGEQPTAADRGDISQVILALGRQDTDPCGLHAPAGIEILGASSDHLVVDSGQEHLPVGAEVRLQPNYSALVRAMTSPFVAKVVTAQSVSTQLHSSYAKH